MITCKVSVRHDWKIEKVRVVNELQKVIRASESLFHIRKLSHFRPPEITKLLQQIRPYNDEHLSISPQKFSMATFPKSPRFPLVHHSTPIQSYNYPKKSQIPRWTHAINKIPTRPPTPYHHNESFSSILNNDNEPLTLDDLKGESVSSILEKRRKNFQRDDLIELIGLLETKVKGLEIAYQAAREESEFYKQIIDKHDS